MLSNYWKVLGFSIAIMIIFSACMILVIAYMGIENPYARIIVGKTLSLFALAIFGQSEALKIYLHDHKSNELGVLSLLNQIGAALTIFVALLLMLKIYAIEGGAFIVASTNNEGFSRAWINIVISPVLKHSEIASLSPLLFFAGINLLLWLKRKEAEEIGRVCFMLSDVPVLLPIVAAILLISSIGGYGSDSYKLLVGGATVMLIFSSIILTESTKAILHDVNSRQKQHY